MAYELTLPVSFSFSRPAVALMAVVVLYLVDFVQGMEEGDVAVTFGLDFNFH